jgi:hypothetical protein
MNDATPKPCSKCGGPRDKPGQRYCRRCSREYHAARRVGRTEMHLTPEERDVVLAMRTRAGP